MMSVPSPLTIVRRRFTPGAAMGMGLLFGGLFFFTSDKRTHAPDLELFGLGWTGSLLAVGLIMALFLAHNWWSSCQTRYRIYDDRIELQNWFFGPSETTVLFRDLKVVGVHRNLVQRLFGRATLNLVTVASEPPPEEDDSDIILRPLLALFSVTFDALFGHGSGRWNQALYDLGDWEAVYTRLDDGLVAHHRRDPVRVAPRASSGFGHRVA